MAKALRDGVRVGQVGLIEAIQKANMMCGPEAQLGPWWTSPYFTQV
jgi:hypothetical protein